MAGVHSDETDDKILGRVLGYARTCFGDYDDIRQRWSPIEAKHRARFVEIQKLPNYYEQRDALAELGKAYIADLRAAKLDVKGATWNLLALSGLPYEVDAYVADLDRKRGITRSVKVFGAFYPAIADDTLAADVYCSWGTLQGTLHESNVSWLRFADVLPKPRAKAVYAYLDRPEKRSTADLAGAPMPKDYFDWYKMSTWIAHSMEFPIGSQLAFGATVQAISRDAHGVKIRATLTGNKSWQYNCQESDKVDGIDANGRIQYRTYCDVGTAKQTMTFVATFPDAPTDIRKGDWVELVGLLRSVTPKDYGEAKLITFDIDGKLVAQVARAKKAGDPPEHFAILASY